jgi:hypothetical protein
VNAIAERFTLLIIGTLVIGALAWEAHVESAKHGETHVRAQLDAVRAEASAVDDLALSARFGELARYDPLVDALQSLDRDVARLSSLEQDPDMQDAHKRAQVDVAARDADVLGALSAFRALLGERRLEIERLKSQRGVLTNSEHRFPAVLGELRTKSPGDANVENLEAALLGFLFAGDSWRDDVETAGAAIDDEQMKGHLRVILQAHETLDKLTPKLIGVDLAHAAAAITQAEETHLAAQAKTNARLRVTFLIAIGFVAVLGLWFPRRR